MQSKRWSLIEASVTTAIGFVVALITTELVLPLYGFHPSFSENVQITVAFTVVSIIRSYAVRRFFNWYNEKKQYGQTC